VNRRLHARVVEVALEQNAGDLLGYFERRLPQREDAADLLAESLSIAWRRRASCPEETTAARMWLFTIARHVLANHRRSGRRTEALARRLREQLATAPAPDSDRPSPLVHDALESLPAAQRELVVLVHWEGFGVAEAGQVLGIGASTARSRYAAARERLRRSLSSTQNTSCGTGH
jgi:RNA polymerase sigma-70 factor, ECF subfamily